MSLFGNKSEKGDNMKELSNSNNIIGKGTVITGDIESYGNIRIDGKLTGHIRSKSKVILGPDAEIEGNIYAQNAEVEGFIKGKLEITEILNLHASAKVEGDIITGKLVVQAGAHFDGTCQMGDGAKSKSVNGTTKNGTSLDAKKQQPAAQASA